MTDQFLLRLPDGMRERLKTAAEANGRSMNAEIVARLTTTFEVGNKAVEFLRQYELLSAVQAMPSLEDFDRLSDMLRQQSERLERLVAEIQDKKLPPS